MNNPKGLLIVFSAPSGCGKDTILRELLSREECGNMVISKSATTRAPRHDEQHGKDYYFVSRADFLKMIEEDKLIEFAEYNGNYYGTPREPVDEWLAQGKTVFLEIEVQGASKVRRKMPGAVSIFILPPSLEELERRLRTRKTDSPETIAKRIAIAPSEIARSSEFDYCVVNDDVKRATDEVYSIVKKLKESM